jgi:hypothetical protein
MQPPARAGLALLFLHTLPLDGTMWSAQAGLAAGCTYMPTLYGRGATVGRADPFSMR